MDPHVRLGSQIWCLQLYADEDTVHYSLTISINQQV